MTSLSSIIQNLLKISSLIFLLPFFLFFSLEQILAQNLLIVEVQIEGKEPFNDFIKIYNPQNSNLDISKYKLRKKTSLGKESSIRVFPEGSKILAKNYFIWSNSRNNYHLEIKANVWSTATLSKDNSIALLSPENTIIDALSWGENQNPFVENLSFQKNPIANQRIRRKQFNEVYQDTNNNTTDFYLTLGLSPNTEEELKEKIDQGTLKTSYSEKIFINEILPNTALGIKDEEGEYLEIFNKSNFKIDLTNWKIEDLEGRTTFYVFPKNTKIEPQSFLVFYRPVTKITLNNDYDGLSLIDPVGKIIYSISYEKALQGQSYNKINNKWIWSLNLTPGSKNIISSQEIQNEFIEKIKKIDINVASNKELQEIINIGPVLAQKIIDSRPFYSLDELVKIRGIGPKTLENIKKQGLAWVNPKLMPLEIKKNEFSEKGKAAISEAFKESLISKKVQNSFFTSLIASILAIFSGAIILILKNKLKS